jgi:cysteine-rich secretory family protein
MSGPRLWLFLGALVIAQSPSFSAPAEQLGAPLEMSSVEPHLYDFSAPSPIGPLAVDASSRADVVNFWNTVYMASEGIDAEWTGDVTSCTAGTTSAAYHEATLRRVNFFRAMVGLPDNVTFDVNYSAKCQEAALMMIAEGSLSHSPPNTWACYSADGAQGAGNSNIALGQHGPAAIDLYISDTGTSNQAVGHRRWILFPPQLLMGSGSTTAVYGFYHGSNALWVLGTRGDRPAEPAFVPWPPEGFVPYQIVYGRWSFSHHEADFSPSSVTMTQGGNPIDLTVVHRGGGYGDPTIVWEPSGLPSGAPAIDTTYDITIRNVILNTELRTFSYSVTIIDPSSVPPEPTTAEIVNYLLGLGPDPGDLNVNGDDCVDASDIVVNLQAGR